ncbi:murein transglycosylase D [Shimwellia pseudoproteus]|uniref:murein transglycosylase D n=1 Tax=Shimwellia pseudoproteus TaxID=570012 RepID=UPI0018EC7569|nr:murein transglycosylase D [Shimwellia pseudoproteus]MBJ3816226.1 murein transglycosylase D [Shimwellia pseudoproteus]
MKAKAILLASVLLAGCQSSHHDGTVQQHAQSLSAASQSEAAGRATSARWLDDGTNFAQDHNLWASISDELKMGIPENDRIREQKQRYLRNKSYLHDVTLRAEPYMYWIAGQVKKRNMPMELVLLPIVESAFNPHATSAANAAGIWQIVPSTGRNYGLKQTRNYDARRDVVASTTAALNLMQRLNRMFDGDWLLTVAAYNSGEGRVLKAIKANKARGQATDFWSLSLPQETRLYVPKMLALSEILKNSKKYGVRLPTPDESRALARVEVNSPVDMSQLAEVTGMSLTKLKAFNAGYRNTTVVGQNGPQYVMVPQKHAALVRKSIATGGIAAVQPSQQLAANTSSTYKVRAGDSLSTIAARLNVSSRDLQQWNNLRNGKLKAGQTLRVMGSASGTALASNSGVTYKVRRGDSLASIARKHGVGVKDLMRWNSDADDLKPGDQLTLFLRNTNRPDA